MGRVSAAHVANGIRRPFGLVMQSVADDDPDSVSHLSKEVGHELTRRQMISEPIVSTTMTAAAMPMPV